MNGSRQYIVFWGLWILLTAACFAGGADATTRIPAVGFITAAGGLGDDAYTDMTYQGIRKAQRKYRFTLEIEQPDKSGIISVDAVERLLTNVDLLIFLGSQHSAIAVDVSERYPDKQIVSIGDPLPERPNLLSVVFRHQEGAFLVGALAAWMSQTKTVGFIGGTDFDIIHRFRKAFSAGVAYGDEKVCVQNAFIVSGPDSSGFTMPQKAYEMALTWYRDGVDIIFAVAGPSGLGVIHAAKKEKKLVIGVDTDQDYMAKGHVLTSMMKRTDRAIYNELSNIMEGAFMPGVRYYGLKEGGVGMSPMRYTRHLVPDAVLKRLEQTEQKIVSGEIIISGWQNESYQAEDEIK